MNTYDQTDMAGPFSPAERLPDPLPADPFPLFVSWFAEARRRGVQPNPDAMTLATVDGEGRPSARIVLCKHIEPGSGYIVFHTNYLSRKGAALADNPRAAVVFHWDAVDRQVRIEGPVTRSPEAESDAYFASRRWESRVGAWASDQSRPIDSREALIEKLRRTMERFGVNEQTPTDAAVEVPRPPHWGGFRVWAERVELWAGSTARIHDRAAWTRELRPAQTNGPAGFTGGPWRGSRLQP